jgi:hypothetical protein
MMDKALSARSARVDPDNVIRNSLDLQRRKMANVKAQLEMPPVVEFDQMSEDEQLTVCRLGKQIGGSNHQQVANAYRSIIAHQQKCRMDRCMPETPKTDPQAEK